MCSLFEERSCSWEPEELLLHSMEEKSLLADMQVLSRIKNHEPFGWRDQLKILNHGSVGFLYALGKQRLVKLTNISCSCTSVTVNLIGNGTKLVLKRTPYDREFVTTMVFDTIEDGEINFYIVVKSGTDRSLYQLEIIFHCPSGDHRIFISDICGTGYKFEMGKKIVELKQRETNNCVSVILNEETNVKLKLNN